jgi:hypothetical protein
MKSLSLVVLFLVGAGAMPALAQRHDKNVASIGGHFGRSEKGQYAEISYLPYLTNHIALRVSGVYEYGNLPGRGKYSSFNGRVFFAPQLFRIGEFAYVHLLLGGGAGYEQTNVDGSGDLPTGTNKPTRFTYGPQAGAEADFFLGNRVSVVVTATKSYLFNNPLIDEWPGQASVGLRYHFR